MKTQADLPLIFDMDGVWIKSDVSLEMLLQYLKAHPFKGPIKALRWGLKGKATLKHELQRSVDGSLDIALLPVNETLRESDIYRNSKERVLVSGSHGEVVNQVAQLNPDFQWSEGSNERRNLIGDEKAALLKSMYPDGYAYIGDSVDDVPVWASAQRAYAVQPSREALRKAKEKNIDVEILQERPSQSAALIESMRIHQWSKNCLVFMMMLLNIDWLQTEWFVPMLATFVAFGFIASATYLCNDLLDLQADRTHESKRDRPLASGRLKLKNAILGTIALTAGGFAIAATVGWDLVAMLAGYAIISLAYSFKLKRIPILDATILSLLFCWRVIAGSLVINVELVPWFTASLALFFFSLALGKRGIELQRQMQKSTSTTSVSGRGYRTDDYPIVMALGVASGLGSAIVTMIYALFAGQSIISEPILAFATCGLLAYWLGYVWLTINRGEMHHDPIIFALKDKTSLCVLGLMSVLIVVGQLW